MGPPGKTLKKIKPEMIFETQKEAMNFLLTELRLQSLVSVLSLDNYPLLEEQFTEAFANTKTKYTMFKIEQ